MIPRAAISWSGGKDSYLALHRTSRRASAASARQGYEQFDVVAMVTMFDEEGARSRSHGLRPAVVEAQADRLGLSLFAGRGSWAGYEAGFRDALARARALDITHVIFGDIMYDSNRAFPERVCAAEGLICVEPIFGEPTVDLYQEFIRTGADARMVTVRDGLLDASWLGRRLTLDLLPELTARGVDPCGELGEYHTVVVDAPLFSSAITVDFGKRVLVSDCWAIDMVDVSPAEAPGGSGSVTGEVSLAEAPGVTGSVTVTDVSLAEAPGVIGSGA
jgi:diphthine-ammonia ligase